MITFRVRKDVIRKDGTSTVRLQVCKGGIVKPISLKVYGFSEFWDDENEIFITVEINF